MTRRLIRSQSSSFSGKFCNYFIFCNLLLGFVIDFCNVGIFATAERMTGNKDDAATTAFISFEEWLWLHKPRREQDFNTSNNTNNPLLFYSTANEFFERKVIYHDNLLRWEYLNSIPGGARYGPETEAYADKTPDEFANLVASCYRSKDATNRTNHSRQSNNNADKPRNHIRFKHDDAEQAPDGNSINDLQNSNRKNIALSLSLQDNTQQQQQQEPFTIMDIDWRAHAPPSAASNASDTIVSYVTPVKNQGPHGTCWSFAAAENLEGLTMRQSGNLQNISEQEFISCCEECQGAAADRTFEWLMATTGGVPALEDSYPYIGNTSVPCRADTAKRADVKLHSWARVVDEDTTGKAILDALRENGPMGMGVDAKCFHGYQGGIVRDCQSHGINHAVLMVAAGTDLQYYDTRGMLLFPQSVDFFVIKNSWGGAWGEEGYVRIERGKNWWGPLSVIYTQ